MDDTKKVIEPVAEVIEPVIDPIAARDEEIHRLTEERDNYRTVALKRLGKLPGDANFVAGEATELSVEEQVRIALLDKEIQKANQAKEAETHRLVKENAELRLALKNQPQKSIGGGGGAEPLTVKDNILSEQQIEALRQRAIRLKADPDKFIETAKKNLQNHR